MNILTSPKFQELKTARELPSSRGVVRHIMRIAQNDQVTAPEIARVVKADPALAARVMKAANAAPLADRRPVIAVPDAVSVLGVRAVRQVALGFSLLSSYSDAACQSFDHDGYWQRSLATAIAFSAVAVRLHAAPPEEAFVTGLLSRIGTLALATIYPREYEAVLDQAKNAPERLVSLERDAFATDHNELCAALLGEWGMPRPLVEGVFHHERPDDSRLVEGSRAQVTASALHYARALAEWCVAHGDEQTDRGASLHHAARQIGISDEVQIALLSAVASEWHEARQILVEPHDGRNQVDVEAADADSRIIVAAPLAPTGLKLLVADDDPAIVQYLRRVLASQGHDVFTASNGLKALELALSKTPHIVITDWVMPEMDGVSLCRALRQTAVGRGIYVLVMTDSQDVGRLVEAFDAGADDFVRKPVSPKVLTARLRAAQRVLKLHADFERDREEMRRVTRSLRSRTGVTSRLR